MIFSVLLCIIYEFCCLRTKSFVGTFSIMLSMLWISFMNFINRNSYNFNVVWKEYSEYELKTNRPHLSINVKEGIKHL